MRTVNVRTLHERTGEIVDLAGRGQVIVIVRRGVPVAELSPIAARPAPPLPDREKILARYPKLSGDSTDYVSDDRD